jgi:hypothetical protein
VLETTVKLWVIAAVNDGASPNRKFFALHSKLGCTLPDGLVYKTPNLFFLARMIYFFADVPHLIKKMPETASITLGQDRVVGTCGMMVSICCFGTLQTCFTMISSMLCTDYQNLHWIMFC